MPIARALAIGSGTGTSMLVSDAGTTGGIWNAFGYVDVLVFLVMLPGTILATPLGVVAATHMDGGLLKRF